MPTPLFSSDDDDDEDDDDEDREQEPTADDAPPEGEVKTKPNQEPSSKKPKDKTPAHELHRYGAHELAKLKKQE